MADVLDMIPAVPPLPTGDGSTAMPSPSRIGAIAASLADNSLAGVGLNIVHDAGTAFMQNLDPSFDIKQNKDLFKNVGRDYYDEISGAKNRQHGEWLQQKYTNFTVNKEYLDELGIEGTLYEFGSYLADVPLLSAFQKASAAGKLGSLFINMNKSYTGRVMLMGTVEGSFETVKQIASPTERTELDMLVAVVGGGVLGGIYNPLKYDKESVLILKNNFTDSINAKAAGVVSEKQRGTVENLQFNITSHFSKSNSPTMKSVGDQLFHDVLKGPQPEAGFKATATRDIVKDNITNAFKKNFDPVYLEFMNTIYGKGVLRSRFSPQSQENFYRLVGEIHYGIDTPLSRSLDPALLAKIEQANAKMSGDSFDVLYRAEHPKFIDGSIKRKDDYLTRRWQKDLIQASKDAGDFTRVEFKNLVKKSLESQMAKLSHSVTKEQVKKATEQFTKRMFEKSSPTTGKEMYLVQDDAMRKAIDELQELLGLSDAEAVLLKTETDAAKSASQKGLASSSKFRTPLDLNATITTKNGEVIALKKFLDTDVQSLWGRYGRTMGGDTALRQVGFQNRQDILKLRNNIEKELRGVSGNLSSKGKSDLDIFDNTMADLLGKSTKTDPNGDAWRVVRSMNNLVRFAKLGATWFSMASELAQTTHAHGVVNMFKTIPALRDLSKAYRGKDASAVFWENSLHVGLAPELGQNISALRLEDTLFEGVISKAGRTGSELSAKLERGSDVLAEATALLGGVKSGTAILEYWSSLAARRKMLNFAQKGINTKGYDYFRKFGFTNEMTDKIVSQINRFSDKNPNYPLLNLDKWDDNIGHQWSMGVRRRNAELIQRANLGDQNAVMVQGQLIGDTMYGNMAMNLKSYMLVAYNKQLSKGLMDISRGGKEMMDTFGNWGYQAAFASVSYIAKAHVMYGNDKEKLDKMMTPERIAANSFSMSTYASFLPNIIDLGAKGIVDEPIFNTYGKQASFFAAESYVSDLASIPITAMNYISPYAKATQADLNRAVGTTGLGTFFLTKQLTTELTELLGQK
tara:strand:- start:45 stop:3128 length:3084 start_codon:yes stop_codon:yes gene_type:complete